MGASNALRQIARGVILDIIYREEIASFVPAETLDASSAKMTLAKAVNLGISSMEVIARVVQSKDAKSVTKLGYA